MPTRMPGPTSHSYFSQRLRLHYVDWGNEDAPPMLLIHGGRDHCRNWDWVAQEFRNDYHIIAPDLRGHGDSQWLIGGVYRMTDFVYDIAQLIHQTNLKPLTIVGHSLGGAISLCYSGIYPETVTKLVAIEGLGLSPKRLAERPKRTTGEKLDRWITEIRKLSGRVPRRYPTLEDAYQRMQSENPHLSPEQARHLTVHGVNQNEDGTYSWKFDNYVRANRAFGMDIENIRELWQAIACPTLLFRGTESWASDPATDGRASYFKDVRVENVEGAGHWVHHDQFDKFVSILRDFLGKPEG